MNSLPEILGSPPWKAVGSALIHFVWQGSMIAGFLWLARRGGFLRSAHARYAASCAALALSVAVACGTVWHLFETGGAMRVARVVVETVSTEGPVIGNGNAGTAASSAPTILGTGVGLGWFDSWLPWVVLVWCCGVLLLALRLIGCWAFTQHIRTRCLRPVSDSILAMSHLLSSRMGISRLVRVVQSTAIDVPVVIGWLRPVILLPASVLTGLSREHLQTILAHELAHVRRCDYLVNLLQSIAETLLFYHPAVWWISGLIRTEREHCCDDLVLAAGEDRFTYAEALAGLELNRRNAATFALAATDGALSGRIQRILSGSGPVITLSRPAAAMGGSLILALAATVVVQGTLLGNSARPVVSKSQPSAEDQYFSDLPEPMLRRLSGSWTDAPVETVIAEIGKAAGQNLVVPADVLGFRISVSFDNARVCDALSAVTERQRFGWRCDAAGKVDFYPWTARASHLEWRAKGQASDPKSKDWFDAGFPSITYRSSSAPLSEVMQAFGNQMGARIRVDGDLARFPVTCDFHLIIARQALPDLLAPLGLDYRVLTQSEIEVFRR